jgi:signal transduction histidine kinase/CheY-like chemotaxis protein
MSNQPSLFSLSLSIGQSFDLKINCTNFLNELRVVKDLDFASVWIKNKLLNTDLPSSQVTLVCHVPESKTIKKDTAFEEVVFQNFQNNQFLTTPAKEVDYNELFPGDSIGNSSSMVIPLGEIGYLQMLVSNRKTNIFGKKTAFFKPDELSDFLLIIEKFTVSLSNCLKSQSQGQNIDNEGLRSLNLFSDKKIVATMNHEIRNPMNVILGYSEFMADTDLTKKQAEYLEVITTSSKHLFNVLNEVMDFSKILARQFDIKETSFDVNDLIRMLISSNKSEAEKKEIELSFSVDKWIIKPLIGDKHKLLHALQYLVDNAIKFTNKGFVRVSCELVDPGMEAYKLAFSVEDSGIGIEEKNLNKIFKSFKQEDDSITRKFGGMGLGLSISRHIIRAMGGEIEVQSKKGVGTKFSFTLELKIDKDFIPSNEERILHFDKSKTKKIKVLLVDDDQHQRNLGGECLTDWNFTTANNGEEAVELLRKNGAFDIVLMDIRMPVMDGIEATRLIRNQLNLTMPIIAVSGEVLEGTIKECSEAGMNSFVSKPYKREELINRMINNLPVFYLPDHAGDTPDMASLNGRRALVVEDNMVNQMITVRQLKNLLCEVDVVDDGNLVLNKIQNNTYDFILMDLYMNEMGGCEATREIRKNGIDIPVIAFSGDDSTETIENCFDAGMNGLILKPSPSVEMASKINAVIFNSQTPKIEESKLVDLSFLQQIFVNNPDKVKSSIRNFIEQASPVPEQLNLLFAANNFDRLWHKAHYIKSSVLSLGIKSLKVVLEEIVSTSRKLAEKEIVSENDKRVLHQRIQNFETILNEAITLLKKEID